MEKTEVKTEIATKAYRIDLSKIQDGFMCTNIFCYAQSLNKAKSELLDKIKYDCLELPCSDEKINYLNIPVIRFPDFDLQEFEGQYLTKYQIEGFIQKRKRLEYFNTILNNQEVTHCYIRKHGSYYRPHAAGYTAIRMLAGVYTKEDAIRHGKSCDDLQIIPINNAEHNKMIELEIEELKARVLTLNHQTNS